MISFFLNQCKEILLVMLSFAATFLLILIMIVFANLASSLSNTANSSSTSYLCSKCHNLCDLQFSNYFEYRHCKYNLRHIEFTVQTIHNAKQDRFRHFFFNRIVSVWNCLSNDLVSASSLSLFKLRLYKFDLHAVASLVF